MSTNYIWLGAIIVTTIVMSVVLGFAIVYGWFV